MIGEVNEENIIGHLMDFLWEEEDLVNRALDVSKVTTKIVGMTPVKLIQRKNVRLLISKFNPT